MVRIMTWNCLGMDNQLKRTLLTNYVKANSIDFVFLQEGSSDFTNAVTEANSQGSILFPSAHCSSLSADKKIVDLAFSNDSFLGPSINAMGGVSRAAFYNTLGPPAPSEKIHVSADYVSNPAVQKWVFKPADNASIRRNANGGAKMVGGTSKRPVITDREWCDRVITSPIQLRANLMGQRRPKVITLEKSGKQIRIYYWHAPLGSTCTLSSVGLKTGNENIIGEGSGGELAVAANLLFKKFLGEDEDFPSDTLLVGDLNITGKAVDHIYRCKRVSSEEGWCHGIAPPGATLTLLADSNTMISADALGGSDHAPVVFDVIF